nr:4Fe-4S dicluster domain-containing protein [Desulfobacterales bacterium]
MSDYSNIPEVYRSLQKRLDQFPIGAPEAPELYEILQILFTEEEAYVASRMPMRRATLEELSLAVGMEQGRLREVLENMADKGLILDLEKKGQKMYMLQGTLTGFFEFSFLKPKKDWPMDRLAELTHKYYYEGGHAEDFLKLKKPRARTVVLNRSLEKRISGVKPYEEIEEIVKNSGGGAILKCYCRNKASLRGEPCKYPIELCISLGRGGELVASRGMGRKASVEEIMDKITEAEELGLVHAVDNFQENVGFICNCCSCHCEFLAGIIHFRVPGAIQPSNFVPERNTELCISCGTCVERCPVKAISIPEGDDAKPVVDEVWCIGCGVCVSGCPQHALSLARRKEVVEPPKDMRTMWQIIGQTKQELSR